jgi:hypothetical protein
VAAVTTVWRKDSHADVLIPKLLVGYDLNGRGVQPAVDVVSLHVEQIPENDLSRAWTRRTGVPQFGSVREALTLGGEALAVDAVLIVGEHGEYPWNEKGQHLYPRRELFEAAVDVIRPSGRRVPIFNDKHFSYTRENTRWMVDTAAALDLPLMAGSSLPVTHRSPELELPYGARVTEALVISNGPTESYGFHALETLQCMVERRAGGETGVAAVETLHGDGFWEAWRAGRFPRDLFDAARAPADHGPGAPDEFFAERPARATNVPGPHPPVAFLVEYADGLRASVLNLGGFSRDNAFAVRVHRDGGAGAAAGSEIVATAFKLERTPPRWHFNLLAHHVEQFFLTGRGPYPVQRTELTSGVLAACMDAGHAGHRLETPHLAVRYQVPPEPWLRANGQSLPVKEVWGFDVDEV